MLSQSSPDSADKSKSDALDIEQTLRQNMMMDTNWQRFTESLKQENVERCGLTLLSDEKSSQSLLRVSTKLTVSHLINSNKDCGLLVLVLRSLLTTERQSTLPVTRVKCLKKINS